MVRTPNEYQQVSKGGNGLYGIRTVVRTEAPAISAIVHCARDRVSSGFVPHVFKMFCQSMHLGLVLMRF